jgi:hypothetical protein
MSCAVRVCIGTSGQLPLQLAAVPLLGQPGQLPQATRTPAVRFNTHGMYVTPDSICAALRLYVGQLRTASVPGGEYEHAFALPPFEV